MNIDPHSGSAPRVKATTSLFTEFVRGYKLPLAQAIQEQQVKVLPGLDYFYACRLNPCVRASTIWSAPLSELQMMFPREISLMTMMSHRSTQN